jgi:hypothetical protein
MISKSMFATMMLVAMGLASPAFAQVPPGYYDYAPGYYPGTLLAMPVLLLTPTSSQALSVGYFTVMAVAGHPEAPLASNTISTRRRTTEAADRFCPMPLWAV